MRKNANLKFQLGPVVCGSQPMPIWHLRILPHCRHQHPGYVRAAVSAIHNTRAFRLDPGWTLRLLGLTRNVHNHGVHYHTVRRREALLRRARRRAVLVELQRLAVVGSSRCVRRELPRAGLCGPARCFVRARLRLQQQHR